MNRDFSNQLKRKIRAITPEQLESHGILHRAHDGNFACPFCGNGEGEDGTGIQLSPSSDINQTYIGHCFRCGEDFDVIRILSHHFGISDKTDFANLIKTIAKEFNFELEAVDDNVVYSDNVKRTDNNTEQSDSEGNYAKYIRKAQEFLVAFITQMGGLWRGLTLETLQHFRCGFFRHADYQGMPRVIIPTESNNHYLARLVLLFGMTQEEVKSVKPKQHHGRKEIFNIEAFRNASTSDVFFATEGEIDAMSLYQVGFNAIAFSSCQISKFQKDQLAQIENKPKIIVLFDNDAAGKLNAEKASKALRSIGFNTSIAFLPKTAKKQAQNDSAMIEVVPVKDANDALMCSPEYLTDAVNKILADKEQVFNAQSFNFEDDDDDAKIRSIPFKTSKQIFPDCPVDIAIPHGYFITPEGIWKTYEKKEPQLIAATAMFISKAYEKDDNTVSYFELVFWHRLRHFWKTVQIKGDELSDTRAFNKKMWNIGAPMDFKSSQSVIRFLSEMINFEENQNRIESKKVFSQTGWLGDDFRQFAYPTDENGEFYVRNGDFDFAKAFRTHGNVKDSLDILNILMTSSPTSRLVLGAVACAPLIKILGVRNPQLHLCSKSGAGKTAVIKAAMSMFGDPMALRQTFANTQRFIEEIPARFNDLPVWIDELQSMNKFARLNMDEQIYNFENGITRGRLSKDAEIKTQSIFSSVRITSGEQPITNFTSGQGAKNRVIELDFDKIISVKDAIKIHKIFSTQRSASYGHFGRKFVQSLSNEKNIEDLIDFFDKTVEDIRFAAVIANNPNLKISRKELDSYTDEQVGLIPSHIQMLALFMTAAYGFSKVAYQQNKKSFNLAVESIKGDINFFTNETNISKIATNNDRIVEYVMEITKSKAKRFQRQAFDGSIINQDTGEAALGILLNNGSVAFYKNALTKELNDVFQNPGNFVKGFHEFGILDEGNSNSHKYYKCVTLKESLPDGGFKEINPWLIVFRDDAEEFLEKQKAKQTSNAG